MCVATFVIWFHVCAAAIFVPQCGCVGEIAVWLRKCTAVVVVIVLWRACTAVGVVGRCECASLVGLGRCGSVAVAALVILRANCGAVVLVRQTMLEAAMVLWRRECRRLRDSVVLMKGMLRSCAYVRAGRSPVSIIVQSGCGYGEADFDISQLFLDAAACLMEVGYNSGFTHVCGRRGGRGAR